MSAIHELSPITTLPEYDLFVVPPTQDTVERIVCYEYRPISTLDSKSTLEIVVENNFDEYALLREAHLQLKVQFRLAKADKTAVKEADWSNVVISNYLLHSLFKHVDVYIGDKQINTSSTTYPYRAYLETLLFLDEESKNTYLQGSGWQKDEKIRSKLITPIGADKSIGRIVDLVGRLHLDLTFQERPLIGGTTIRLKLVPHDVKFFVQVSDANLIPNINFVDASWFIPKAKLNKLVVHGQIKGLSLAPVKYPITRVEVKSYSVGKGSLDCNIENGIHGQLPRRMTVGLISNDAYNGSLSKNPFDFQHFGLKYLCCYIDGQQHPLKPFTPNFREEIFSREYLSLFHSSNQIFGKVTTMVTKDEYLNGNVLYGFNFAPDLTDGCSSGHFNLIKRGSLRIEIHFESPIKETVNVILFCEYDNMIQIGEDRNAVTDFN